MAHNNHHDEDSLTEDSLASTSRSESPISEDETRKLIASIRQIAPSAEQLALQLAEDQARLAAQLANRPPSPNDQPIIDEDATAPQDALQFEKDKKAVYRHPLFPLVGMCASANCFLITH